MHGARRCSPPRCSHRTPPPPPWSPRPSAGPCGSSAPAAAPAGWPRSSATTPTRPPAGCAGCASSPSRPEPGVLTSERVLVADDHKAVRDGLRMILGLLAIEVPGAAAGGTDAARQAAAAVPGVILMDLHMPDCDAAEATRPIARQPPHVR